MRPTGVFLDASTLGPDIDLQSVEALISLKKYEHTQADENLIIERLTAADIVITNKVKVTRRVLQQCPQLKLILTAATGTDHVDIKAAQDANISVRNTRNYAGPSVAQHVLASILYFTNNQHIYHQKSVDGTWSQQPLFCLFTPAVTELSNKKIGILGFGNLGQQVATLCEAFGMQILVAKSLQHNTESKSETEIVRVPFDQMLEESDFISIHCPLNSRTKDLFGESEFSAMKSSCVLINTARGAIIQSSALLQALDNKSIGGAALDVFIQEPLPLTSDLLQPRENLLITPHVAWASQEARQRLVAELRLNLLAWINDEARNLVLP